MDSFEINKIAGAVLGALTVTLGLSAVSGAIFSQHKPEKPGYEIAEQEPAAGGAGAGAAVAAAPIETRLASADPAKGEAVSKRCGSCHSFEKGGAAKTGPNLYGVVGAKHAHVDGFGYSAALKGTPGQWDFASLDKWLENPKGYIAGTSMAFAGLKSPEERGNLIAYLNKNSDSPVAVPAAAPAGAAPAADAPAPTQPADGKPAEGAQDKTMPSTGDQGPQTGAEGSDKGDGQAGPGRDPGMAQGAGPTDGGKPADGAAPAAPSAGGPAEGKEPAAEQSQQPSPGGQQPPAPAQPQ